MQMSSKEQVPRLAHHHAPRFSSQTALSREALETSKDRLLGHSLGVIVHMWMPWLPGQVKKVGASPVPLWIQSPHGHPENRE
jgi:hypothetical protein